MSNASSRNNNPQNIWIVGCGDIGCRLADLYHQQKSLNQLSSHTHSIAINGIVRSQESMAKCIQHHVKAFQLDLTDADKLPLSQLDQSQIFYFAPPPPKGEIDIALKGFLQEIGDLPQRIVLISTTGIYGDSQGDWIDEDTDVNPTADRAKRRYSAEQTLQHWSEKNNKEFMILRVPGIYAKDRLPLARLQKGLPIVNKSEAGWTNRIHADDLAQACKLAMESSDLKNEIINVTDGNPSTMTDYFNHVADYANLPRPPQITMQQAEETLSDGMVSYLKESRRIRNDKMLSLLKIKLKYPNLITALNSFD